VSRFPSYAEMAARPPPPYKKVGEGVHCPDAPGGRESGMVAPGQGRGWRGRVPQRNGNGFGRGG
jgi:hypothetical protein